MACIYVVEDDADIREIELFALKNSGHETEGFGSGKEFSEGLQKKLPDLVLLDIMLPDKDGLDILKELRTDAAYGNIPVILVTAKTTELDKVRGLDTGADDYISKPFGIMELISRVNALLRRTIRCSDKAIAVGEIMLDPERHMVKSGDDVCDLTYKEFQLLQLLMENSGTVVTRADIMSKIWGFDYVVESRTLDMHIKTLRHKLGEAGARIKTVRNVGYVIE